MTCDKCGDDQFPAGFTPDGRLICIRCRDDIVFPAGNYPAQVRACLAKKILDKHAKLPTCGKLGNRELCGIVACKMAHAEKL